MIDPALARRIRVVGLDVDGVLTDGGIYLGSVDGTPHELKRYDIRMASASTSCGRPACASSS